MSGKKGKRTTFLTETSNLDETKAQKDGTDDSKSRNTEINDEYNDDIDDDLLDEDDEYPNPFFQQYSESKYTNNEKESIKKDDENSTTTTEYEKKIKVISAVAPKLLQQDDTQIEVSSTPAFQCLEEVFTFFFIILKSSLIKNYIAVIPSWKTNWNPSCTVKS
jgi:hypothetical protein